jgi:hypothetical protein
MNNALLEADFERDNSQLWAGLMSNLRRRLEGEEVKRPSIAVLFSREMTKINTERLLMIQGAVALLGAQVE